MTVNELEKAVEGLGWVAEQLKNLPSHKTKADATYSQIVITQLMVAELALNLGKGMELPKAFRRMVTGWKLKSQG